jgi:site-specific recombinase XerD
MSSQCVGFQGPLASEMRAFVDGKRTLGRRYLSEEKQLRIFDAFLVQHGLTSAADVTPEVIGTFLASLSRPRPRSYNEMLGVVRRLFEWLVRQGRLSGSPVRAKPRRRTAQRIPYLLDPEDARRLLELAGSMPDNPRAPLRGPSYKTIFALLYGLGLRVGEVARLCRADVDFDRDLLIIRDTKFGKSRLVPFGPRIGALLRDYVELRGSSLSADSALFSFTRRAAVHPGTISQTFHQLVRRLGLVPPAGVAAPRVHDLRHSFAVGTLLRWYRDGVDPAARLFHLATFLGHANPSSTAVYLTITTELLAAANRRFEGLAAPALREVSA